MGFQSMTARTIISELAEYSVEQCRVGLNADVVHAAKRAIIDWFASLLPGTLVEPALSLRRAHVHELGLGYSSLPGCATTALPATAAWINGGTSHAVEFDDIFRDAVYHPGCPTVSSALALAEHLQASGMQMLKAVTMGYEISTRIGVAVQPSHYRYFHTTGTVGCFGAAAAAATLLAPGSAKVAAHALATSATFASGLQQAFRSDAMSKALHAGHAAWVGVTSAQGAASGVTGVLDILEGDVGFGKALAGDTQWSKATEALGRRFNIKDITLKAHGCCGHTFAAIDGILALRTVHDLCIHDIESVEIYTYKAAIDVAGIRDPKSVFECKFSLPYVVAHAAKYGSVRISAFSDDRMADPEIRSLTARVALFADAVLTASFPVKRAARVRVILKGGRALEHFSPYRQGDPESPLTDEQIDDKFKELVSPVLGDGDAARLLERLWALETLADIRDLRLAAYSGQSGMAS